MSDQRTPDDFVKRSATPTDTAAKTYLSTIALTTAHWLSKCLITGHWVYIHPDDALVEAWILGILPTVHLLLKVAQAKLDKWAAAQGVTQ